MIDAHTHSARLLPADADHPFPVLIGGGSSTADSTNITVQANESALVAEMRDSNNQLMEQVTILPKRQKQHEANSLFATARGNQR